MDFTTCDISAPETRTMTAREKYEFLIEELRRLGSAAIAFSGGVDSTFLLAAAKQALGTRVLAVTAAADWFPERERIEAEEFCRRENIRQRVVPVSAADIPGFRENPPDRCYRCKKALFERIIRAASQEGISAVCEGSNMDDLGDYRPGLQAVRELGVLSPLRVSGMKKDDLRALSRELGLPTWDKPSFACLASRFVYGETITPEKLRRVEQAEDILRAFGFRQFRVRIHGDTLARIEVLREDFPRLLEQAEPVSRALRGLGFLYVSMDLDGFRSGSMNAPLKIPHPGKPSGDGKENA